MVVFWLIIDDKLVGKELFETVAGVLLKGTDKL
jgi:hypothetical protein